MAWILQEVPQHVECRSSLCTKYARENTACWSAPPSPRRAPPGPAKPPPGATRPHQAPVKHCQAPPSPSARRRQAPPSPSQAPPGTPPAGCAIVLSQIQLHTLFQPPLPSTSQQLSGPWSNEKDNEARHRSNMIAFRWGVIFAGGSYFREEHTFISLPPRRRAILLPRRRDK